MNKIPLGKACNILNGYAFKSEKYVNSGYRVIRITNVQKGFIEDEKPQFYPVEEEANIKDFILEENDLLLSLTGNVGRVAILEKKWLPASLNQRVACLRVNNNELNKKYIYYALLSSKFEEDCITSAKGIAQKNMSTECLKEYSINVPTIEKQVEIVKVFDKLSSIISSRKEELDQLDILVKARFVEMFGTLHDNQNEFDVVNIEDVCSLIKDGTHQTPQYTEDKKNGYKFLSSKDVMSQKIDWSDIKYIPVELHEKLYATVKPQRNDILMSKNGVNYGVAAVNDTDDIFDIYVSLALLRPKEMIAPVFFRCVINNPETKRQFDSSIKGIGVPNLHLGEIKKTKVFLPPMELQRKFVDFVHQVDKSKLSFHLTRYELRR